MSVKFLKTRYPEIKGVHIFCTLFLQKPQKALTEMIGKNLEKVPCGTVWERNQQPPPKNSDYTVQMLPFS